MLILATGDLSLSLRDHTISHSKGFTLIELLVVIVIIGITIALIVPNFLPDDSVLLRREAQTTGLRLQYAYNYAESTGRPIAWLPKRTGSEFQELDESGRWRILSDHTQLTLNTLPVEMTWGDSSRIIFVPGDAAPEYQISLSLHNKMLRLKGDALGKVTWTKVE
jgi:general secretion pathway protein H